MLQWAPFDLYARSYIHLTLSCTGGRPWGLIVTLRLAPASSASARGPKQRDNDYIHSFGPFARLFHLSSLRGYKIFPHELNYQERARGFRPLAAPRIPAQIGERGEIKPPPPPPRPSPAAHLNERRLGRAIISRRSRAAAAAAPANRGAGVAPPTDGASATQSPPPSEPDN